MSHPVGETLPMEQWLYRLKVLKTFLRAAVPLSKLDAFRDILEENMFCLIDRRHMSDHVPFICVQERADIKAEISGKPVSVVFDGTTKLERQWQLLSDLLITPLPYSNDLFAFSCL